MQKALENQGLLRLSCGHIMVGFAASGVCVPARISVLHRPGRQRCRSAQSREAVQIRQGALHLAVPMLYISTKGGAPYRGEGGLHGANHNEVEGNSVTISKDEKFSF